MKLWLKKRPRLMLRCSKADRGILIGSFASSKQISAYWTTYQHSSSCRFHLRWSWRGERRLNIFHCSLFRRHLDDQTKLTFHKRKVLLAQNLLRCTASQACVYLLELCSTSGRLSTTNAQLDTITQCPKITTDKRGEEPASGRPRSPPRGGCGDPKPALQQSF